MNRYGLNINEINISPFHAWVLADIIKNGQAFCCYDLRSRGSNLSYRQKHKKREKENLSPLRDKTYGPVDRCFVKPLVEV